MAWPSFRRACANLVTKPKSKRGVLLVERWILAALRKRTFFSLADLNQAIAELLDRLNQRPFRKLEGSRAAAVSTNSIVRPCVLCPPNPTRFAEWKKARVNIDYHVEIEHHYYSVPYALVHRELDVRYTAMTVEIFHGGQRVASHARSYKSRWLYHHQCPSAQIPSTLPGMDARASGPLGVHHRSLHRRSRR